MHGNNGQNGKRRNGKPLKNKGNSGNGRKLPTYTDSDNCSPKPARDYCGKFIPGNHIGMNVAQSHMQLYAWRKKFYQEVKQKDFRKLIQLLVKTALEGQPWAMTLLLHYLIGKPTSRIEASITATARVENAEQLRLIVQQNLGISLPVRGGASNGEDGIHNAVVETPG